MTIQELELQDLVRRVEAFEEEGFELFDSWTMDSPVTPDRILMPSKRIMDIDELDVVKEGSDPEVAKALEYYNCLRGLPIHMRDHYSSFVDDVDVERCRIKYAERYRTV